MSDSADDISGNWLPSVQVLSRIDATVNTERRALMRHILEPDAAGKATQLKRIDEIRNQTLPTLLSEYEPMISSPEERALFQDIRAQLDAYHASVDPVLAQSNRGDEGLADARQQLNGASSKAYLALSALLDKDTKLMPKALAKRWAWPMPLTDKPCGRRRPCWSWACWSAPPWRC